MASTGNRTPDNALFEPQPHRTPPAATPPAHPESPGFATRGEQDQARAESIANLINSATAPSPMPSLRSGNALSVAERAIAPLSNTLAAIDAGIGVIVENLRNADTTGYKTSRTAIGDKRDVSMQVDVSQGELLATNRALDIAIQGDGFLPVRIYPDGAPEGVVAYTRNGMLFMNNTGQIVVGDLKGYQLVPPIKFPGGVTQVTITQDGDVRVAVDRDQQTQSVGQISLAVFTDPTALSPLGGGVYEETAASGRAISTPAGSRGAGRLIQGHVELSNLDLVREKLRLDFLKNWRATIVASMAQAAAEPHK